MSANQQVEAAVTFLRFLDASAASVIPIDSLRTSRTLREVSFADFVRDPEAFSTSSQIISGALFHWQARTPAVDEDVDPPKKLTH